jgi:hypothetical protein
MNDRTRKNRIIASFIGTVSLDPEVQKLLAYSVDRVLSKNEPEDYSPTTQPDPALETGMQRYKDFKKIAAANRPGPMF